MSTAEERWARAAQLAEGVDDDGLPKRRRWFRWVTIGPLVIIVPVAVLALELAYPRSAEAPADDELTPQFWVGASLMIVGMLGALAGLIWGYATHHYPVMWRAVLSPLNRQEGRSVARQLKSKEPIDTEHRATILAAAAQARRQAFGVAPGAFGLVLFLVGSLIAVGDNAFTFWICIVALAVILAVLIGLYYQYRNLGRFIEANAVSPREA